MGLLQHSTRRDGEAPLDDVRLYAKQREPPSNSPDNRLSTSRKVSETFHRSPGLAAPKTSTAHEHDSPHSRSALEGGHSPDRNCGIGPRPRAFWLARPQGAAPGRTGILSSGPELVTKVRNLRQGLIFRGGGRRVALFLAGELKNAHRFQHPRMVREQRLFC